MSVMVRLIKIIHQFVNENPATGFLTKKLGWRLLPSPLEATSSFPPWGGLGGVILLPPLEGSSSFGLLQSLRTNK